MSDSNGSQPMVDSGTDISTNTDSSHHLLDDELVGYLENDVPHEDSVLTEYMGGSSMGDGDERTQTIAGWLPESGEMKDETFISPQQAKALAVGRAYNQLYATVDMSEELAIMQSIFDDFEKYLVSMHGMGREQQVSVLQSLFGTSGGVGESGENEATISLISNTDES